MLSVSPATTNNFSETFVGNQEHYGATKLTGKCAESGKVVAKSYFKLVRKGAPELSWKMYREHLEGKQGLGIAPMNKENNCLFGVIDVDDYNREYKTFITLALDYNLPFCFFRSKSGGLHAYVFFTTEVKAKQVRDLLAKFLIVFGLPRGTEIFPKQERLINDDAPSWINLPYFGDTDTYMYGNNGEPLSLEQALYVIDERKVEFDYITQRYRDLPLGDGPICLQSLFLRSTSMMDGDGRNNYLFNIAIYYKASNPGELEEAVFKANELLTQPKTDKEIRNQILKPVGKKSYSYRCTEHPLCDNCHKELCRARKYGKGGTEVSNLDYGQLTQVMTEPPHYIWMIDNIEMVFYKESELREQTAFSDQCMRYLHRVPNTVTRAVWSRTLNSAFEDIKQEQADDSMSPGVLLWEYFREYISDRPKAQNKEQLKAGYIFLDNEKQMYIFKKKHLLQYLQIDKLFRHFAPTEIQRRLFTKGVGTLAYYIAKGWVERVWFVPINCIQEEIELSEDKIDFNDLKPETEEY